MLLSKICSLSMLICAGVKAISGCQELASLKVGISLHINDEGLIHVGNCCSKLQELDLYRFVILLHFLYLLIIIHQDVRTSLLIQIKIVMHK